MLNYSGLERNTGYRFAKRVCQRYFLQTVLDVTIVLTAFVGCILNTVFYNHPEITEVRVPGLVLHFLSLGLLLLYDYLVEWSSLNTLNTNYISDPTDEECVECWLITIQYCMAGLYAFFIIIFLMCLPDGHWHDPKDVNRLAEGMIIYFASLLVLWYSTVVFRQLIPNICKAIRGRRQYGYLQNFQEPVTSSDRSYTSSSEGDTLVRPELRDSLDSGTRTIRPYRDCFQKFFLRYGFYEIDKRSQFYQPIWSTQSLCIIFTYSIIFMNACFALYYIDSTYYITLLILSVGSVLFSFGLLCLIFVAHFREGNLTDEDSNRFYDAYLWMFISWLIVVGTWILVAFILFFVYLPYNGWPTDATRIKSMLFVAQGAPAVLVVGICVMILLILTIYHLRTCLSKCRNWFRSEYESIQNEMRQDGVLPEEPIVSEEQSTENIEESIGHDESIDLAQIDTK